MSDPWCNSCAWPEACSAKMECERRRRHQVRGRALDAARRGPLPEGPALLQAEIIEIVADHAAFPLDGRDRSVDKRDRRPVRRK